MSKRILFVDALKGFAVFCVLWGHSLQYLRGAYDFSHNPMFELIYSFHMPLFFMISGFFFASSLRLSWKDFLLKKGKQLVLPNFTWAVIFLLLHVAANIYYNAPTDYSYCIKRINFPFPYWFLKELFWSYALSYFLIKILRKQWLACVLSIVFVLLAPGCEAQRSLLPLFWVGIYLKNSYQVVVKYSKQLLLASAVLFAACLLLWDGAYMLYASPLKVFNIRELSFDVANVDVSLFRLAIGVVGSMFWFLLFQKIYQRNHFFSLLSKAGTYTMGIYILQLIVLEKLINWLLEFPNVNSYVYNFLITPLTALSVGIICVFLVRLIAKNRLASIVLLGQKY